MSDPSHAEAEAAAVGEAAARLEAALERIARAATSGIIATGRREPTAADARNEAAGEALRDDVVARLDALIARTRAALAEPPQDQGATAA